MKPEDKRDPIELLACIEALAQRPATHELVCYGDSRVVFRGTLAQCQYVQEGYDLDMRENHPDAVGPTFIAKAAIAKEEAWAGPQPLT